MRKQVIYIAIATVFYTSSCQPESIDPPPPPPTPTIVDTTIKDIPYGSNGQQKFDLGLPGNRTSATSLAIVIHGGGWATGDKNELSWLLNGLKQRGFVVANINYRTTLNSSDNYKMQLDDVDSALHVAARLASTYVYNGQQIYILGHSAGGHLALCYAYTRNGAGQIKAVGSLSGPTDLFNLAYYNFNIYNPLLEPYLGMPLFPATPTATQRYQDCSPFYQATATSPPTIFFHGELDPIVPIAQSTSLAGKLNSLSVDQKIIKYPFTFHDWWTDGTKTKNTMDELKAWFLAHP
ncbi:MAG: alpha/beta hydrolase [Chitinophagaceae bacterium]|nr:alpha/beta hydrolase [Chitinophagaceae bacterium]HQV06032.1 alpha/beta hydrolase [Chitinophagaceae bacterium]